MDITTNFALSCRLIYLSSKDGQIRVLRRPKHYNVEIGESTENALTEREAWGLLNSMDHDWFSKVQNQGLTMEGVAQRGRMMLNYSDAALAHMLADMHTVLRTAFMGLASGMGAVVLSKRVEPVQLTFTRPFSSWVVKARVQLAHIVDPVTLRCEFAPSPLNPIGWQMDIEMPTHSLADYEQNQKLIERALPMLAQSDFMLCPVFSGTNSLD